MEEVPCQFRIFGATDFVKEGTDGRLYLDKDNNSGEITLSIFPETVPRSNVQITMTRDGAEKLRNQLNELLQD